MELVTINSENTISNMADSLFHQINNVIQLDSRHLLEPQLQQMRNLAILICHEFHCHQREPIEALNCLERIEIEVRQARFLIGRPKWPKQCFDCLLPKPKYCREISVWKTNVNMLQLPTPQTDWVKTGIKHGDVVIERWLTEDAHVRIIGVCGGAGVGKTTLLQTVYNTYKVSDLFDVVIWVTVAQFGIPEVQDCIARALNLDLDVHRSNSQMRRVKLSEYLKTKKFLLIFDNMWNPLDINKLGVEFGDDTGSKFICSSRRSDVIELMTAKNILYLQPLTREEGWELFRNIAFKEGHLPEDLEHIARQVADECQGSPIAINLIGATMKGNTSINEWNLALRQMQTPIDHRCPSLDFKFDKHYQILRCGYDRLPSANLKSCFIYCAMFPRDEDIDVEKLVGMWIAEDLVCSNDSTDLINTAHGYLKVLVDRCFFQVIHIPNGKVFLKTHSILFDMAIFIGKREEHCLVLQGLPINIVRNDWERIYIGKRAEHCLHLQGLPINIVRNDWKRISFYGNNITYLSLNRLKCSKLACSSLVLAGNKELEEVPMLFLDGLPSIRVLDLSKTKLKALPITLWQLTQLKYLDVSYTEIECLSEDISSLCELQFLNLCGCSKLKSLPKAIGHLSRLQSLNASGCTELTSIPSEIYEIKSLKCLQISRVTCNFTM